MRCMRRALISIVSMNRSRCFARREICVSQRLREITSPITVSGVLMTRARRSRQNRTTNRLQATTRRKIHHREHRAHRPGSPVAP